MSAPENGPAEAGRYQTLPIVTDGGDVLAQQIAAEVASEVPPHGVNVIPVVLRVVVLDEESGTLNPIVMLLSPFRLAGPREADFLGYADCPAPALGPNAAKARALSLTVSATRGDALSPTLAHRSRLSRGNS